jgi:hypothetical protein
MWLLDCGLDNIEWRRVLVVYTVSISPIFLFFYLTTIGQMKKWITYTIISSFFIAMFGWEIWLNFGILDGQHVDMRRSEALSCAIPSSINWLINSLGDVSIVWFGIIILSFIYKNKKLPFEKFIIPAFIVLLSWFVLQNIWVEIVLYYNQVGGDARLSWAPLMPLGPWYNPTLFSINGREVTFQGQIVWLLAAPIYYLVMIYFYKKTKGS